ncbi:MAG: HD domain-containing protein [Candidatus Moraniibacteriota bacterium]
MKIITKIKKYNPKGGLSRTAELFLALSEINHKQVKEHAERVALLSEAVATKMKKDKKATFFAGLLHDIGKIILSYKLFDGHNIDTQEYEEVKRHAISGFEALSKLHEFTALCAGLHHNLYKRGYGVKISDFPKNWSPATAKKVLEISAIVSVCDFIDAFTHRKTEIKDGSNNNATGLKEMLKEKYPDDHEIIRIAIKENKKLGL